MSFSPLLAQSFSPYTDNQDPFGLKFAMQHGYDASRRHSVGNIEAGLLNQGFIAIGAGLI
jgi:hypothetical protein